MEICLNWIPRRASEGAKGGSSSFSSRGREPCPGTPKLATQAREGDLSPYLKRGFLGERGGTVGRGGGQFFRLFCGLVEEHEELTLPRNPSAPTQQGHTVGPFDVLTA